MNHYSIADSIVDALPEIIIDERGLSSLDKLFQIVSTGIYVLLGDHETSFLGDIMKRLSDYKCSSMYLSDNDQYIASLYTYAKSMALRLAGEKLEFIGDDSDGK